MTDIKIPRTRGIYNLSPNIVFISEDARNEAIRQLPQDYEPNTPLMQAYTKLQEAIALVQYKDPYADTIIAAMDTVYKDLTEVEKQLIMTRGPAEMRK